MGAAQVFKCLRIVSHGVYNFPNDLPRTKLPPCGKRESREFVLQKGPHASDKLIIHSAHLPPSLSSQIVQKYSSVAVLG